MGSSSTPMSPHMAVATTILVAHLPTTSIGGLRPPTACSPVMGGITFLPGIPSFVYGGGPFPTRPGEFPHAPASVAPSHGFSGLLLRSSLAHEEHHSSSGSDVTRSVLGPGYGPPLPSMTLFPLSSLAPLSSSLTKVLKLDPIKGAEAYLDALGIIKLRARVLQRPRRWRPDHDRLQLLNH
jgi:hypothetical protein